MAKGKKNTTRPLSAKLRDLIASAGTCGLNASNAFEAAVVMARSIGNGHKVALADAGGRYKGGYVAARLQRSRKSWGNLDETRLIEAGIEIYAKPYPESSKPNRRTEEEHKACRSADVSWHTVRARAGLVQPVKRKPRPASNGKAAPPVDLVKASPKFTTKAAANDYFATATAALLATVNRNARLMTPSVSSAISDLHAAMVKAGFIKSAK